MALVFLSACSTVDMITPQPFTSLNAINPETVQGHMITGCPDLDRPILVLFIRQGEAIDGWALFFTDQRIMVYHFPKAVEGADPDHLWIGTVSPDQIIQITQDMPMSQAPKAPCDYLTLRAGA